MTAAAAPDGRLLCAHCVIQMTGYGMGSVPVVLHAHRSGHDDHLVYGVIGEQVRAARTFADSGWQLSTSHDGVLELYAVTMVNGTALCARHALHTWEDTAGSRARPR